MRHQSYSANYPFLGANLTTWLINSTVTVLPAAACILIEARQAYCKEHNVLAFSLFKEFYSVLYYFEKKWSIDRSKSFIIRGMLEIEKILIMIQKYLSKCHRLEVFRR
jgi:hypothetical protein